MKILIAAYWLVALVCFAGAMAWVFSGHTPVFVDNEVPQIQQKIFYFHMPIAVCSLVAAFVVLVASIGYLAQRKTWWDDLASASASVSVVLCTGVLLTGMLWARGAWGWWWTWRSPRLVFSLMLWLLYVVYLLVRASIEGSQRRAVVAAVYGLVAFLDVPLVYLSARLIPDSIHPPAVPLSPDRQLALELSFAPIVMAAAGLIVAQYSLNRKTRAVREALHEAQGGTAPTTAGGAL